MQKSSVFSDFDKIFNSFTQELNTFPFTEFKYRTSVSVGTVERLEDKIKITLEVPGFNKDSLKISAESNNLTIQTLGEKPKTYSWKDNDRLCDFSKISAKCLDGILTIELPFKPENQPIDVIIN